MEGQLGDALGDPEMPEGQTRGSCDFPHKEASPGVLPEAASAGFLTAALPVPEVPPLSILNPGLCPFCRMFWGHPVIRRQPRLPTDPCGWSPWGPRGQALDRQRLRLQEGVSVQLEVQRPWRKPRARGTSPQTLWTIKLAAAQSVSLDLRREGVIRWRVGGWVGGQSAWSRSS